MSLRGVKRLRGNAEANPEIPRSARNKLRNPNKEEIATLPLVARKDNIKVFNPFVRVIFSNAAG